MDGIGAYLEKFKNFLPPGRAVARAVQHALREVLSIEVEERDIRVRGGVAEVALPGVVKSEMRLHKDELLAAARAKAGPTLKDIR